MPGLGGTTNNYEILAQLASGGMAEIFLARVTAVGGVERHVVLKRILPMYKDDEQFVTMFLDEARLQAQLRHPNIAQLHDVGRLGSTYFYTMEYVHGETLASVANRASARSEQVPLQHVLSVGAGVAAALHHAHTRIGPDRKPLGIVHRDVSPANVMITFDGVIKLLDFGVAKSKGRRMQETHAGVVKGKVAYLSPEQIGGKPLDGRSDLFSLGICMYEMLTLHQLFARKADIDTLGAIVQEQVPPPSYFRKDVPPEIDAVVMNALAKDPANRFASAEVMQEAIENAAARTRLSLSTSGLGRYLGKTFGSRAEPWLDFEALAPVTVMGDIIQPTEGIAPAHLAAEAEAMDAMIRKVPMVKPPPEDDDFAEIITDKRTRATLPMAAAHPQWEATVMRSALPSGLDLGRAKQVIDDEFAVTLPLEGGRRSLPTPPAAVELRRPVQSRPPPISEELRSGANPRIGSGPRASPSQSQWPATTKIPEPTSWNVPRLVMAGAVLVAIIVAIWIAVS